MAGDNLDQDTEVVGEEVHVQGKEGVQEGVQEEVRILQQKDIEKLAGDQSRPEPKGTKGARPVEGHILQGTEVETMVHLETKALPEEGGHMMVNTLHGREVGRLGVAAGLEGAHMGYSGEEAKTRQVDCHRSMSASVG